MSSSTSSQEAHCDVTGTVDAILEKRCWNTRYSRRADFKRESAMWNAIDKIEVGVQALRQQREIGEPWVVVDARGRCYFFRTFSAAVAYSHRLMETSIVLCEDGASTMPF